MNARVGRVGSIQQCAKSVVVIGWAPFTSGREALNVWADGPVTLRRVVRNDAPEVRQAAGNSRLVNPGFVLVLRKKPALAEQLCLQWAGRHHPVIAGSNPRGCRGKG